MAVVAVAADNSRYDSMDTVANTNNIGGGTGEVVEPDIVYQGSNSVSRKVTSHGFYTDTGTNRDVTTTGRRTWLVKTWLTNYGSLTTTGNSHVVRVGSGTGAYYEYIVGSPAVDYPSKGGWVLMAIDPNIASHRDASSGSPTLTACSYFAAFADCSGSKTENLALDAIDFGVGLYLTGGDGGDTDGTFQDFIDDDEGDITNGRFGYVSTVEGVLYILGRLVLGATSASDVLTTTATGFTDTAITAVFPDNKAAAGFSGLTIDLGNASTSITFTRCTFNSVGTSAGEDTRAVLDVTGTSGDFTCEANSFSGFASLTLTTSCTLSSCTVSNCGQIDLGGGASSAGADISGSSISASTATSAVLWDANADTVGELDNLTFSSGGTGHAIELGTNTPTAIEFSGHSYSGYAGTDGSTGNEVLYNNSGKSITVSVTDGGAIPTVRNGAGASTTVSASKSLTFTGLQTGSEVRVYRTSDDEALGGTESSTTSFTYNYTYTADTPIYVIILHIDYQWLKLDTISLLANDQSVPVQQVTDRNYDNP